MLLKGQCFLYAVFFHWCKSKNNSMHHWWPDRKGLVSRTTLGFFCMSAFKRDMAVHVDHKSSRGLFRRWSPFSLWSSERKKKYFPLSCTCRPLPSSSYFLPLQTSPICDSSFTLNLHKEMTPYVRMRAAVFEDKIRKVWFMETQNVRVTKKRPT